MYALHIAGDKNFQMSAAGKLCKSLMSKSIKPTKKFK